MSRGRTSAKDRPGAKQHPVSLAIALLAVAVGIAVPLGIAGDRAGAAAPYVCIGAVVGVALGALAFFSTPPTTGTAIVAVSLFVAILAVRLLGGGGWGLVLPAYIPASLGGTVFGSTCDSSSIRGSTAQEWTARGADRRGHVTV